jgi:cytidine deaminase
MIPVADLHQLAVELSIETAALLAKHAAVRRHQIACGILLDNGQRICGVNVVSNLGPASVCAEQITLGESLKTQPDAEIVMVVALRALFAGDLSHEIVAPCGRCREILYEYAPAALVLLPAAESGFHLTAVDALLPHPFYRRVA